MTKLNQLLDATQMSAEAEELGTSLREKVVGQEEAIREIVDAYQTYLAGMNSPERPIANFLFLGPTGTGKTRMVEAVAESLIGDARAVVKIDCAEFQHSHEVAKLIGSPPGYLGHRETHPALSQEVLDRSHTEKVKISFVLFDEIEKASDALWNLLLGILDKATLTLGDNRRVDFSRAMIFLTSNLGAVDMAAAVRPGLGFAAQTPAADERLATQISRAGIEAARRRFTPEFMNRIDKTVVFHSLTAPDLKEILNIELGALQRRIWESSRQAAFAFSVTDGAKDYLLHEGTDMRYGARHLKRAIDRALVRPISNLIATRQVRGGDLVRVDYDPERKLLAFYRDAEGVLAGGAPQAAAPAPAAEPTQAIAAAAAPSPQMTPITFRRYRR
jgi:ATP-dependent Clp protease ATP-binding subunit ClpB